MHDKTCSDDLGCVSLPVEAPLTACLDPATGVLTLESTIHPDPGNRRMVRLLLRFSADAAQGFIRLLRAVEDELGIVLTDPGGHPSGRDGGLQ